MTLGDRESLSIGRAIDRAAKLLPEGWEIRIEIERHSGSVILFGPDGERHDSDHGELFSEQIDSAIEEALENHRKGGAK